MFRTLLAFTVLLLAGAVLAPPTFADDAEVLALAGPRTCSYGGFYDILPHQVDIPIVALDPGFTQEYCFHLKRARKKDIGTKVTNGFVTLQTANLSKTSCGTATVYMIRPNRKSIFGKSYPAPRTSASVNQVQPAGILAYTPGTWRVLISYASGDCNKYSLTVTW